MQPHMGDGGGGDGGGAPGGGAPPLASKNLSPLLEPKIRDLKKNRARKGGKLKFLRIFSLIFVVFLVKRRPFCC